MHEVQRLARLAAQGGPGGPDRRREIEALSCSGEVRAGLLLLNGDWDAAHKAAQALHSSLAFHWHALVHRHEPDFPNAKYWLRRVGDSPIYPGLAAAVHSLGQQALAAPEGPWEPYAFTDCYADPAHNAWTRRLDALEQRLLLEHCLDVDPPG